MEQTKCQHTGHNKKGKVVAVSEVGEPVFIYKDRQAHCQNPRFSQNDVKVCSGSEAEAVGYFSSDQSEVTRVGAQTETRSDQVHEPVVGEGNQYHAYNLDPQQNRQLGFVVIRNHADLPQHKSAYEHRNGYQCQQIVIPSEVVA